MQHDEHLLEWHTVEGNNYNEGLIPMSITSLIPKQAKRLAKDTLNSYVAGICREEFATQSFEKFNERAVEFNFVFQQLATLYPRTILDVGTGTTALPSLMRTCGAVVTAIDNVTDYWADGMVNRHYHVIDDDITRTKLTDQWDLVTCISVLEHIQEFDTAVRTMVNLTKPGGHLIITCPYNERKYHRNCYDLPDSAYGQDEAYTTQSFSRKELNGWCGDNHVQIVEKELWRFWQGELWTQGKQVIPSVRAQADEPHQLACLLLRKPL